MSIFVDESCRKQQKIPETQVRMENAGLYFEAGENCSNCIDKLSLIFLHVHMMHLKLFV